MEKRHYRKYTEEDIILHASKVNTLSALQRALGLKRGGGNHDLLKKKLQQLNVDVSHWAGQAYNKDQQLKDWSQYSRGTNLRKHLIVSRGHQCEKCLLKLWLEENITLEVHHIDGDRTNNSLENLQLLCPNCHSKTSNYKSKNRKPKDDVIFYCYICNVKISNSNKTMKCCSCAAKSRVKK